MCFGFFYDFKINLVSLPFPSFCFKEEDIGSREWFSINADAEQKRVYILRGKRRGTILRQLWEIHLCQLHQRNQWDAHWSIIRPGFGTHSSRVPVPYVFSNFVAPSIATCWVFFRKAATQFWNQPRSVEFQPSPHGASRSTCRHDHFFNR